VSAAPKWIATSKTLWINLAVLLATLAVELLPLPDLGLDPKAVTIGLAIANLVLRTFTSQPVTLRKE
jgi:hypothetical protein